MGTASSAAAGRTFTTDVHPIFAAKCGGCHTTGRSGGHAMGQSNVGMAYDDSQLNASHASCTGMKKGQCASVRILNGSMPQGRGCTGNPTTDASNTACLTAAQQAALADWIGAGMPE